MQIPEEHEMLEKSGFEVTGKFLEFVNRCPTASHVVQMAAATLEKEGYSRYEEGDSWNFKPGDKGYVERGSSSLVAFCIGLEPPENSGFRVIGAHTDSPGFHLKPNGCYISEGYLMLGVEVYGGPLLASWTDRDLSLAGKLIVASDNGPKVDLVDVERPVCRIPQLAIHLNRKANEKGLKLDRQKHLPPIAGLKVKDNDDDFLKNTLAKSAKIDASAIIDYSLSLYDTQKGEIGGIDGEFYFSGRIDNQAGCFSSIQALLNAPKETRSTSVVALFDNEEIGSRTNVGAGSTLLDDVLERLCMQSENPRESWLRAVSKSILVSNDGSHAIHPNYSDMHDKHHQPHLNQGPVVKVHAGRKFATSAETKAHFIHCTNLADVPYQLFVNRSDMVSGSTIGPVCSTRTGIPTVDVGVPMLSMHSVRETGGIEDIRLMTLALIEHLKSGD